MKEGDSIKQGGIYAATKARLKNIQSPADVQAEVKVMQRYGQFYASFLKPEREAVEAIRERLQNLQELDVSTSYPLLLRLFDARLSASIGDAELEECLMLVESFVVRRAVCGVPTNALNKLFLQWTKNFPANGHEQWLLASMSTGERSRRFPTDVEFREAFTRQPQYGRGATRFVLVRLEKEFEHPEPADLVDATIEHVLPQTLSADWRKFLGSNADEVHARLVDTFGNLTLTGRNAALGNLPFDEKKKKLQDTHVELNRWILQRGQWGEAEIQERSEHLVSQAIQIWPGPQP
jgi:hypothetical protein